MRFIPFIQRLLLYLAFGTSFSLQAVIFESEVRTFTSVDGRTVEARMDHYNSAKQVVSIRLMDGKKYDIPFDRLSEADQLYCIEWLKDYDASFVRVDFFNNRIEGGRIVFILDSSGSMQGDRWGRMVRNMTGVIQRLDLGAEFNIIHFGSNAYSFKQDLVIADKQTRDDAARWLKAQLPGGGTNLLAGIKLAKQNKKARVYAVLSDGYPSNDPNSIFDAVVENQRQNQREITVYTVSYYASTRGVEFLKAFADRFGGRCVRR